jgi:hypothetical protein
LSFQQEIEIKLIDKEEILKLNFSQTIAEEYTRMIKAGKPQKLKVGCSDFFSG